MSNGFKLNFEPFTFGKFRLDSIQNRIKFKKPVTFIKIFINMPYYNKWLELI